MTIFESFEHNANRDFVRRYGVDKQIFILLLIKVQNYIDEQKKLKPMTKRGRKSEAIDLEQKLKLTFYYLRHYPTYHFLSEFFKISESYTCKIFHYISDILIRVTSLPNRKALMDKGINAVVIDVSEQQIERPLKKQKKYYSGKKKKHTIKVQIVICLKTLKIYSIRCEKGHEHDFSLFKNSRLLINAAIKILADSGYQGINTIHKNSEVPYKATKKKPLTKIQKQFNLKLAKKRIVVENVIRRCKIFRIVKETFRGKHINYSKNWNLIAALVNLRYY